MVPMAHLMLRNAPQPVGCPADLVVEFAEELARCGNYLQARKALDECGTYLKVTEEVRRVWSMLVDAAFRAGPKGREIVPTALQPTFDEVFLALQAVSEGDDEAAHRLVRDISRNCPFAEWKLFIRGLSAYYQGDDERALNNWSRLDPERWPWQRAAAFRSQIDPEFVRRLPRLKQRQIGAAAKRLERDPLVIALTTLRDCWRRSPHDVLSSWPVIQQVLPLLQQRHPEEVNRLKRIVYWEIVEHGNPADIAKAARLFGDPDDPDIERFSALAVERTDTPWFANPHWERFLTKLDAVSDLTPEERRRLEAMIWIRLGNLQVRFMLELAQIDDVSPLIRSLKSLIGNAQGDPLDCFDLAVKADPHWPSAHRARVATLARSGRIPEALSALDDLLAQFPDDWEAIRRGARWYQRLGDAARATEMWERALRIHPLDREARESWTVAQWQRAVQLASERAYDSAVAVLQEATRFPTTSFAPFHRLAPAIAELRQGRMNAVRLVQQLEESTGEARVIALGWLWTWANLLQAPPPSRRPLKLRWDQLVNHCSPTAGELIGMARLWRMVSQLGADYRGSKSNDRRIREYLKRHLRNLAHEEVILEIGTELGQSKEWAMLRELAGEWQALLPNSAVPLILWLEAERAHPHRGWSDTRVRMLLSETRTRLQSMPAGPLRHALHQRWQSLIGDAGGMPNQPADSAEWDCEDQEDRP